MTSSYLRVVSRVHRFYVENTHEDKNTVMAGPFTLDGLARNALIALDGSRYEVRASEIEVDYSCDTRFGVFDTHAERFVSSTTEETVTYCTMDSASAVLVANSMNRHQRNQSRLQQYQERHPVTGTFS